MTAQQQPPAAEDEDREMVTLTFRINGTRTNPYAIWGMKQNPFPGAPYSELHPLSRRLNSLGGEPVRGADDIRARLEGFDPEFIKGVIARWRPGVMVEVELTFPRRG